MKRTLLLNICVAALVMVMGCKKDNYKPPSSIIKGRVIYNNQPVGVRSNGVQLELWQSGFQLFSKVAIYVDQDGSFSAEMLDGNYKLTRLRGNGPWADNTDTINVSLNGTASVDVLVDPYFLVKSQTFAKAGTTVNATVNLQRVNTTKALELVRLYIGQTVITDQNNSAANIQIAASAIPDITLPVNISLAVPAALAGKDFVYARIGVKAVGVTELAYGEPVKIMLK